MDSRSRINTAMRGGQPDRVPVWCLMSLEHIVNHGTPDGKIPKTIEDLVTAECQLARRYHFDGMLVYLPGKKQGSRVDTFINKSFTSVPEGDSSHIFEKADPESWLKLMPDYEKADFYACEFARKIMGDNFHYGGWTPDGFSKAIQWFPSLESALIALMDDPQRFLAMVNYFDMQSVAWTKAQIELGGLESIQISSPYAGSSFMSSGMYREFVLSSVKKIANAVKPLNAFTYLHTCGCISDRLEFMRETNVDGIECMDPPPLGNVTLSDAKNRVGQDIFLKGNLDSVSVLLQGSEETFVSTIRDTILAGKTGGGYILSSACSVAPMVLPERVERLAQLAEEYGTYS